MAVRSAGTTRQLRTLASGPSASADARRPRLSKTAALDQRRPSKRLSLSGRSSPGPSYSRRTLPQRPRLRRSNPRYLAREVLLRTVDYVGADQRVACPDFTGRRNRPGSAMTAVFLAGATKATDFQSGLAQSKWPEILVGSRRHLEVATDAHSSRRFQFSHVDSLVPRSPTWNRFVQFVRNPSHSPVERS